MGQPYMDEREKMDLTGYSVRRSCIFACVIMCVLASVSCLQCYECETKGRGFQVHECVNETCSGVCGKVVIRCKKEVRYERRYCIPIPFEAYYTGTDEEPVPPRPACIDNEGELLGRAASLPTEECELIGKLDCCDDRDLCNSAPAHTAGEIQAQTLAASTLFVVFCIHGQTMSI